MLKDFKLSVSRKEETINNSTVITYTATITINNENESGDKYSKTINTTIPYISDVTVTDIILSVI